MAKALTFQRLLRQDAMIVQFALLSSGLGIELTVPSSGLGVVPFEVNVVDVDGDTAKMFDESGLSQKNVTISR